jgi:hypothetical protein
MPSADGETVIRQLGQLGRDLDTEVGRYGQLEETAVEAEGDYRRAYAQEYQAAEGTLEDRKQAAINATDELWRTWGMAIAAVRRQRESLRALHARIDIGRTMASREKALAELAGRDGTP